MSTNMDEKRVPGFGVAINLASKLLEPAVGSCNDCHRRTWAEVEFGTVCNMTQPSGLRCTGTFVRFPSAGVTPSAP